MRHTKFVAGVLGIGLSALLARGAIAQLDPPPGPIVKTGKTLTEVEPRTAINATNTPGDADSLFKITQSGSYYLTGNITGVAGKHGIEIAASGVTLDLNGFRLNGVAGSLDGISVQSFNGQGVTIRNGSIQNWGDCGIEFADLAGQPSAGVVSDIDASLNTRVGILTSSRARVERCTANENGDDGISVLTSSTVSDCTASLNGGDGIATNSGCIVSGSTAATNTGFGFRLGLGNTITSCNAYANATGFSSQGSTYLNCSAYTNTGNGFSLFEGNSASGCSSYRNAGHGYSASSSNAIINCVASNNDLDGIRVTSNSLIRGNECYANGSGANDGAGIVATSADNRIENNNCSDADRGIQVLTSGNFITGNTCSGNSTNWSIAAGNACLVISATTTGVAISGDSGGASPGSTNPNANYTY